MASILIYITAVTLVFVPYLVTSEQEDDTSSQGYCPFPCTQGGQHYCFPVPCPLPPCANPVRDKGACCSHCPNGPNCIIKGQLVPQGQNITTNGQWCTCRTGGDEHNGLVICSRCFDLHFGSEVGRRCI